jgi:ABC-type sugar transport system substrate-binding protein
LIILIEQRTTGFRPGLAGFPDIHITHVCRFPRVGGDVYERTGVLLKNDDANGIFTPSAALDEAARAVYDLGYQGRISLAGYDIDEKLAYYLENGTITATIGHEVEAQSYQALTILYGYLSNGIIPRHSLNYTKLEVIMRYTIDCYM